LDSRLRSSYDETAPGVCGRVGRLYIAVRNPNRLPLRMSDPMCSLSQSGEKVRAKYLRQAVAGAHKPLMTTPIEGNVVQVRDVTRN
jgi:hypothetical protein